MKKLPILLSSLTLLISLFSCKKDAKNELIEAEKSAIAVADLYDEFASVLSKAVHSNASIRSFIKQEALLEFDKDHDVLYQFVKDKIVHDGKTFKELLEQYQEYPNQILAIENEIPLLTIFIPTILESGFSPVLWDSETVIPLVATNLMREDRRIPIYDDGQEIITLKSNELPGFPVLVIKNNERVKLKNDIKLKSTEITTPSIEFISPAFDNSIKTKSNLQANSIGVDQSIIDAYNIFGVSLDYWQRDHIYYNLTPTNTSGRLKTNMRESIINFKITRDALNKISDQAGDPFLTTNPNHTINVPNINDRTQVNHLIQKNAWTDGKFEFRFDVYTNNKLGAATSLQQIYLPVDPLDLFDISNRYTTQIINGQHKVHIVYILDPTTTRNVNPKAININIPILTWDLQNNASMWKINVCETDTQEEITYQETVSNEFATNFGLDLKIGIKFGASAKEISTRQITTKKTLGEDDLGSVLINFGDPVLIPSNSPRASSEIYTYANQYFSLQMIPIKVF